MVGAKNSAVGSGVGDFLGAGVVGAKNSAVGSGVGDFLGAGVVDARNSIMGSGVNVLSIFLTIGYGVKTGVGCGVGTSSDSTIQAKKEIKILTCCIFKLNQYIIIDDSTGHSRDTPVSLTLCVQCALLLYVACLEPNHTTPVVVVLLREK